MEELTLIHKSSDLPWIATIVISIISIIYNMYATKKTQFINTVTSERIRWITTLKEYIAQYYSTASAFNNYNNIIENLNKCNKLRSKIILYLNTKDDEELINAINKCNELRLKIILYLNPKDDEELINAINENYNLIKEWDKLKLSGSTNEQSESKVKQYEDTLEKILYKSQEMLKNEWERVKLEARKGNIKKDKSMNSVETFHNYIKIIIAILGCGISLYFKNDFENILLVVTVIVLLLYALDAFMQILKGKLLSRQDKII